MLVKKEEAKEVILRCLGDGIPLVFLLVVLRFGMEPVRACSETKEAEISFRQSIISLDVLLLASITVHVQVSFAAKKHQNKGISPRKVCFRGSIHHSGLEGNALLADIS